MEETHLTGQRLDLDRLGVAGAGLVQVFGGRDVPGVFGCERLEEGRGPQVEAGALSLRFSAQLAAVTGAPDALSEAGRRLLAVTLTAGLTAASLALAQGLVRLVF